LTESKLVKNFDRGVILRVNFFQKYASQAEDQNGLLEVYAGLFRSLLAPLLILTGFIGAVSHPNPVAGSEFYSCCRPIFFHSFLPSPKNHIDDQHLFNGVKSSDKNDFHFIRLVFPFSNCTHRSTKAG
jgi:hypothetical protein